MEPGASSYGYEFDRLPHEAFFLPILSDPDFAFLSEEPLPRLPPRAIWCCKPKIEEARTAVSGSRLFFGCTQALLSMLILSASMAMNSPLVGLSSGVQTRQPKARLSVSTRPRFQATSMAWRMARSTLLAVVPN